MSNATIAIDESYSEKVIALKDIQKRIKEIELRIKSAQDETNKSHQELRNNEVKTTETLNNLHIVNTKISKKNLSSRKCCLSKQSMMQHLKKKKKN